MAQHPPVRTTAAIPHKARNSLCCDQGVMLSCLLNTKSKHVVLITVAVLSRPAVTSPSMELNMRKAKWESRKKPGTMKLLLETIWKPILPLNVLLDGITYFLNIEA